LSAIAGRGVVGDDAKMMGHTLRRRRNRLRHVGAA
jgi:hypothetical protein